MRYNHTSINTVKVKNSDNTKCRLGYRETGCVTRDWWEYTANLENSLKTKPTVIIQPSTGSHGHLF